MNLLGGNMKKKNFWIVVFGQIVSLLGNAILRFCLSLYVLDLTGSAAIFSTILAISTIPYVLFAPLAGLLADTINRKKIMVYLDLFVVLLMVAFALVLFSGNDNLLLIGIVMFILSIVYTLYGPAVTAAIPQIVAEEELASANAIIQQIGAIVNIVGPIVAGVLYSFVDFQAIIIINAVGFLIAALLKTNLDIPDLQTKARLGEPFLGPLKEMSKTFFYLKQEKQVVLGIIASYGLTNIFIVPILTILTPYFINVALDLPSTVLGLIEAIFVSGMIIGGLLVALKPNLFKIGHLHKSMYPMVISIALMGLAAYLAAENKLLVLTLFALGGLGIMLSIALSNVISLTFMQKEVKADLLGKVSAFSTAIATATVAPGQLIYGQLIASGLSLYLILLLTLLLSLAVVRFVKWNVGRI
jgi:MFS family permease